MLLLFLVAVVCYCIFLVFYSKSKSKSNIEKIQSHETRATNNNNNNNQNTQRKFNLNPFEHAQLYDRNKIIQCKSEQYLHQSKKFLESQFLKNNLNTSAHVKNDDLEFLLESISNEQREGIHIQILNHCTTIRYTTSYERNFNSIHIQIRLWNILQYLKRICDRYSSQMPQFIDFIVITIDGVMEPQKLFPVFSQESFTKYKHNNLYGSLVLPPRSFLGFEKRIDMEKALRFNRDSQWSSKKNLAIFRGTLSDDNADDDPIKRARGCRKPVVELSLAHPELLDARVAGKEKGTGYHGVSDDYLTDEPVTSEEQAGYKYIIHCDGNAIADRLPRELAYNSVILKFESNRTVF